MIFFNSYEDTQRAGSYAKLEFPNTYYLAYRDLPQIFSTHVKGTKAVDFGCGAGRSTRFLVQQGFQAVGVDISSEMISMALELDPAGDYRLVGDAGPEDLESQCYDLVMSAFTFDNIPGKDRKTRLFTELKRLLSTGGRIVNLVSTRDMYTHEWASFSTKDFPGNHKAKPGDKVKVIMKDVEDRRPVEDIFWPDENYRDLFKAAGLEVEQMYKPLAKESEPYPWINETRIAPWAIYVLKATR